MTTLALVAFFGLLGGVLAGLFGVGGGIVYVPVLALGLGLSQLDAEATSLLAILPTVAAGVVSQHAYGNVRWRAGLIVGLAGIAGVELGVLIARGAPGGPPAAAVRRADGDRRSPGGVAGAQDAP